MKKTPRTRLSESSASARADKPLRKSKKAGEPVFHQLSGLQEDRLRMLKSEFPEAFIEAKLDFDRLRLSLGEIVDSRPERYTFSWAGKRDAVQLLQMPSRAALVPLKKESVDFEQARNLFIEGENLEVLKLLYKGYFNRIKAIYIDPPYNTGNDFVYRDNYADPLDTYLQLTGQQDTTGNLMTSNVETSGRFHSAWLTMMYPRLFVARQLLSDDGLVFVSIDDNEVHNLKMLMNEVFGEENRVETFVWKKSYGGGAKEKYAVTQHEYILLYARNIEMVKELWLPPDPKAENRYYKYRDEKFETRGPYRLKPLEATKSMDRRENLVFPIPLPEGGEVWPKRQWWWSRGRTLRALAENELVFGHKGEDATVSYKQYLRDATGRQRGAKPFSIIDGIYTQHGTEDLAKLFDGKPVMQFPKPVALLKEFIKMATSPAESDIVLDFFAGSCTTAQAVLELNREDDGNRRFIMVQLQEPLPEPIKVSGGTTLKTLSDIGAERIRRVVKKLRKEKDGRLAIATSDDAGLRVFRLAASNYKRWAGVEERKPEEYGSQMAWFLDPLVDGWTPTNVIWEVVVREGAGLDSRIEKVKGINDNTVWRVNDPSHQVSFLVCLDDEIKPGTIGALALNKGDLFICRDVALTDELAGNLALQSRLKTI